jgi:hypothetical protein
LKNISSQRLQRFAGRSSPRPSAISTPACYSEIGMRLALTTQAATFLLVGQQALFFKVVLNFL